MQSQKPVLCRLLPPHPLNSNPKLLYKPKPVAFAGQQYEARLNKTLLPLIAVDDINKRAAGLTHRHSAVFKSVEHK
jgi:hypothetical protein